MKYKPLTIISSISLTLGCIIVFITSVFLIIIVIRFQAPLLIGLFLVFLFAGSTLLYTYFFIDIFFIKYIVINEKGVEYKDSRKKLLIRWGDIKTIWIVTQILGGTWMCFSTTEVENTIKTWQKEKNNENYIKFIYRKGMENTIRLYYKDCIVGIDKL